MRRMAWLIVFGFLMTCETYAAEHERFSERHINGNTYFVSEHMSVRVTNGVLSIQWRTQSGPRGKNHRILYPMVIQAVIDCGDADCTDDTVFPCFGKCIRGEIPLLYDRSKAMLYIGVFLDIGTNVPWRIIRFNLDDGSLKYLFSDTGTGIRDMAVSSNCRYVAYSIGWHMSACESGRLPRVFDLVKGIQIDVPFKSRLQDGTIISIQSADWILPNTVKFDTRSHVCNKSKVKSKRASFTYQIK